MSVLSDDAVSRHGPSSGFSRLVGADVLKVALNLHSLRAPRAGIGRYVEQLALGLQRHASIDELVGFIDGRVLGGERLEAALLGTAGEVAPSSLRGWLRAMPGSYAARDLLRARRDRMALAPYARRGAVYHEPNFVALPYAGPTVVTVHDFSHRRHPHAHPRARVAWLEATLPRSLARAGRIIAVSRFTADELCECHEVSPEKVRVIHHGIDADFRPRQADEVAATLRALDLRFRGFVLAVGTLEPRKNLARLLQAYTALPRSVRQSCPLLLVGAQGWRQRGLAQRLRDTEGVRCIGYLPRQQLHDLYAAAAVLAYPSLYEGFGLPLLEGFASATPVLCSSGSALSEVAGGAALEVDALSVDAIEAGLRTLLDDAEMRAEYAARGVQRARAFTWRSCVEQTVQVYREVAGE